jgi:hypothetical protein
MTITIHKGGEDAHETVTDSPIQEKISLNGHKKREEKGQDKEYAEAGWQSNTIPKAQRYLMSIPNWVVWKYEEVQSGSNGTAEVKMTKVLYFPQSPGRKASTTEPRTWTTYEVALACYLRKPDRFSGLGFVFQGQVILLMGNDLDHCVDEGGKIDDWALKIMRRLNSYAEFSPSGTGIHVFALAEMPPQIDKTGRITHPGRKIKVHGQRDPKAAVEMYSEGRFFTYTGNHVPGTPETINEAQAVVYELIKELDMANEARNSHEQDGQDKQGSDQDGQQGKSVLEDDELIEKALKAKNGEKFKILFKGGDCSQYGGDCSAADQALCNLLAFWTGKDREQMDRLFRRSALYRDKWDEVHGRDTYGGITIDAAIKKCHRTYTGKADGEKEEGGGGKKKSGPAQADVLHKLALEHAEIFATTDGEYCARILQNDHYVTMPINEKAGPFKRWLTYLYNNERGTIPNATALSAAIAALGAEAQFGEHPTIDVSLRIAGHGGKVYLDLAQGEIVEVDAEGWRIIKQAPVSFKQHSGMLPLPRPVHGGDIGELRGFVNVQSDSDWVLMLSWLIGCFHPQGPYPILNVHGEKGSTKSTVTRLWRTLVDPSRAPTRKEPDDNRTLAIMAHNNRVLAFDNLSYLPPWLSDALCRLSTGAGDAYRALYTDNDEVIFDAKRPIILNGIEEIATRGDLLDRAITVTLVKPERYRTEKDYWRDVEEAHPRILGVLLDIVSVAIRELPNADASDLPRMADFSLWILSCEHMFSKPGTFMAAYEQNREDSIHMELEASALAMAIIAGMTTKDSWEGSAQALLDALNTRVGEEIRKARGWPKNARSLSGHLTRLAPSLRSVGIFVQRSHSGTRNVVITKQAQQMDANA